jgi:tryptophan synthase alpha chain
VSASASRLKDKFDALKQRDATALVCFITAGDGGNDITVASMHAMVEAGADIIELGMPFSDPMADGPAIQKAGERALAAGSTLSQTLDMVATFRAGDSATPVVLMGYQNPVEAMGAQVFASRAVSAGVDGVIIVDLPPEEGNSEMAIMRTAGLAPIYLIAPNSTPERIATLCASAGGFVYLVSIKGITGTRSAHVDEVQKQVAEIRRHTQLPVGVGFGIRDSQSAGDMATVADAVIVGTVLVEQFAEHQQSPEKIPAAAAALVADLRAGIDARR